jgi:hypothetical protein
VGLLLVSTQPIYAEDSAGFGKMADVLPDGKFGLRISCVGELLAQSILRGSIGPGKSCRHHHPQGSGLETEI